MKDEIISNLDNPRQLEKLYRDNKRAFKRAFNLVYADIKDRSTAQIWNERLNFENEEISWGGHYELTFVIIAAFIAGILAKIPAFTPVTSDYFYPRNIAFIVFPLMTAYFLWRQKRSKKIAVISSVAILFSVFYINILPDNASSDTLTLACIHLPLFLWAVLGFAFVGNNLKSDQYRLDFLKFNGDLVVMTTIILIAGVFLTFITLRLFMLIDERMEEFYFRYIVVWGLAAAPVVGTYLVRTNPQLVSKVSPVIAKVFTPLVLVTLLAYIVTVIRTDKDPYNDRDFLLTFNLLLVGVMAIILFSIAGTSRSANSTVGTFLLLSLSIVTVVVNGIALSAILFRISEWGITPNRLAVLGSNILILTNLLMVTYRLFRVAGHRNQIEHVEKSIASFLPVYCLWTILVTFVFPLLFNFK
ncbi:MAG: hypothetical protein LBM08_03315 [Dysgonamonadaceae bacterium]|jgi:hypothetical protein|nr:hypothetical protein [Dysgonamonadaceae bacterium]